jgi:hypothetical protein
VHVEVNSVSGSVFDILQPKVTHFLTLEVPKLRVLAEFSKVNLALLEVII